MLTVKLIARSFSNLSPLTPSLRIYGDLTPFVPLSIIWRCILSMRGIIIEEGLTLLLNTPHS